jgi:hypothetical protein
VLYRHNQTNYPSTQRVVLRNKSRDNYMFRLVNVAIYRTHVKDGKELHLQLLYIYIYIYSEVLNFTVYSSDVTYKYISSEVYTVRFEISKYV